MTADGPVTRDDVQESARRLRVIAGRWRWVASVWAVVSAGLAVAWDVLHWPYAVLLVLVVSEIAVFGTALVALWLAMRRHQRVYRATCSRWEAERVAFTEEERR